MTGAAIVAVTRAVSDNDVSPGVLGFVVVATLGVGTWLLLRSMNRQLKKIDLPDEKTDPADEANREDRGSPPG
jgi:hypothetical protein